MSQPLFSSEAHRVSSIRRFEQIITYFENNLDAFRPHYEYKLKLAKFTYEYACSQSSKDLVVHVALYRMGILDLNDDTVDLEGVDVRSTVISGIWEFTTFTMENFFIPVRYFAGEVAQRSLPRGSRMTTTDNDHRSFCDTLDRLDRLRSSCLMRDGHRCVISRAFDANQARIRYSKSGDGCVDDDGKRLYGPKPSHMDKLEIAQILPHCVFSRENVMKVGRNDLHLDLLNMIDHGLAEIVGDARLDRPKNGLTLSGYLHNAFSKYDIFFDPVEDEEDTYIIKAFPPGIQGLPVKRKLFVSCRLDVDLPDPRLLAAHRAIGHILYHSGTRRLLGNSLPEW